MKRVIKFWNQFKSDEGNFSDSGTRYEILPILVADDAGPKELRAIAKQLGIKTNHRVKSIKNEGYHRGHNQVTHSVKLNEKTEPQFYAKEVFDWYLGFVKLNESGTLPAVEKIDTKMTLDQVREIIDNREYGLDDVGDFSQVPNKQDLKIVMDGWHYYHEMRLLGYDRKHFEMKATGKKKHDDVDRNFSDSVFRCGDCGTWDYNDSGYTYNYRIVQGEQLGLNCGCHHEFCKKNFLDFAGNTQEPMELDAAEELEKDGMIEHMERFFGGMTDGRSGYFRGESCRSGTPVGVLEEYQEREPKSVFLFTHDESGQFQSYFSLWRVTKKGLAQNKKRRAA